MLSSLYLQLIVVATFQVTCENHKSNNTGSFLLRTPSLVWLKSLQTFLLYVVTYQKKKKLYVVDVYSLHWSLVIICIPDKEDESGPIILHLDSLRLHSSQSIFQNIKW
jgi:hypothetical protein